MTSPKESTPFESTVNGTLYNAIEQTRKIYSNHEFRSSRSGYMQYMDAITMMCLLTKSGRFDRMFMVGSYDGPSDNINVTLSRSLHLVMRGDNAKWYATETRPDIDEHFISIGESIDEVMNKLGSSETNKDLPKAAYLDVELMKNKLRMPEVEEDSGIIYSLALYFTQHSKAGNGSFYQALNGDMSAADLSSQRVVWILSPSSS